MHSKRFVVSADAIQILACFNIGNEEAGTATFAGQRPWPETSTAVFAAPPESAISAVAGIIDSVADYNKDASFQFEYDQGKNNYQIYDGNDNTDSGVASVDSGIAVSVTVKNADAYDFQIEILTDGKITKLLNRKLRSCSPIRSIPLFNRNNEKGNAFFNQLQVTSE